MSAIPLKLLKHLPRQPKASNSALLAQQQAAAALRALMMASMGQAKK